MFKTVFKVTQDEDFLQCGGVSSQVAKVFAKGTGPGPDPSQPQWDFNNPASSAWNQAVISQLMYLLWWICNRSGALKQDQTNTGSIKSRRNSLRSRDVLIRRSLTSMTTSLLKQMQMLL